MGGSIPAWAGQPLPGKNADGYGRVYPRVGGATITSVGDRPTSSRSIPAWAGQPQPAHRVSLPTSVYPRVGGATLVIGSVLRIILGLSPRGRGNRSGSGQGQMPLGSIPAWAGQPTLGFSTAATQMVYPRVGGATAADNGLNYQGVGLSPRGRGNQSEICPHRRLPRSIPRVGGATNQRYALIVGFLGLSPRGRGNQAQRLECQTFRQSIPAWAGQPTQAGRES